MAIIRVHSVLETGNTKSGTNKPFDKTTTRSKSEKQNNNGFDGMLNTEITRLKNGGTSQYQQFFTK